VHDVPHELRLVFATQAPVPAGQWWNPALQAVPQAFDVHTAWAFGSAGVGQVAQDAAVPQAMVLSSGKQPLVAGHMCVPAPQTTPQAPVTQPWPVGHGVQSTPSIVPQVSDELLLTQMPPQMCQPVLQWVVHVRVVPSQVTLHVLPVQVAVPLVGAAQAVQPLAVQPEATLLLATQFAFAPFPHRW
jgi:hypothetical protein